MDDQQGDALFGVEAIVLALFGPLPKPEKNKKLRQVNHLLKKGHLPGRKVGKFWIGSKRRLRQFVAADSAAEA
jgi:hypothetical protein